MSFRSSVETTVIAAIQRIGDLFGSTHEFYLWMVLLHGDGFKDQLGAVRLFAIQATPSHALDFNTMSIYERTSRILEAHANGLELVTMMRRARLYWDQGEFQTYRDQGEFKTDFKGVDPLPGEYIEEWGIIVSRVAINVRFVSLKIISWIQLMV